MNRVLFLGALLVVTSTLRAETGYDAWLRYARIDDPTVRRIYEQLPATVVVLDPSPTATSAASARSRAGAGMPARRLRSRTQVPEQSCFLLGTLDQVKRFVLDLSLPQSLGEDGYLCKMTPTRGHSVLLIPGANDRGILYGTFALLRK